MAPSNAQSPSQVGEINIKEKERYDRSNDLFTPRNVL
jgi:hypothetical protein